MCKNIKEETEGNGGGRGGSGGVMDVRDDAEAMDKKQEREISARSAA